MQFYEASRFTLLWLIPIAIAIFVGGQRERRKKLSWLGDPVFIEGRLMPAFSRGRVRLGLALLMGTLFLSTLALARPQWGEEKKKVERKGVDLVFLLDTSLSMLAEDAKPSRLAKSKLEIKNLIYRLKGDRVGMVAFAGSSFLQCPLTLDYAAFLLFVDALKPGYIPNPGTSLNDAIRLGIRAFPEESQKYRAILIFSDGEDHEGGMEGALEEAKKAGVRLYTVGVGTPEGEPIPLRSGTEPKGKVTAYKKDRSGNVVITRLNPPLLEQIAKETGGLYLPATAGESEIELILRHLETLGEHKLKEQLITEREDHFQLFLFLAFLLLLGETFFKNQRPSLSRPAKSLLALLVLILLTGWMDSPRSLVQKGNELSREKKYQSAVEKYRKAQVAQPKEPVIRYNLGTALYRLYEYADAEKELEQALSQAKDPRTKAKTLYNYGNTKYRLGDFEHAIEAYKKALELDPKDEDAKYNLEFLKKKKALFDKKQEERQKQQKNEPQKNQQQNQQQQKDQQQQKQQQQQQQTQNNNEQQQEKESQAEGGQKEQDQKKGKEQKPEPGGQQNQPEQKGEGEKQQDENQQEQQQSHGEEKQRGQDQREKREQEEQKRQEDEQQKQTGQEQKKEQFEPQEGQGPEKGSPQASQTGQPLQGQMSKEDALRMLEVLREGEKELQDLRRPQNTGESREVLKDW